MPFPEDLDALSAIAARASEVAGWDDYSRYLKLRSKGLRRASLAALRVFIEDAAGWDFARRQAFARWLADQVELCDDQLLIPYHLLHDLLVPTIREWLSHDPGSAIAHFLCAKYCRDQNKDPLPLDALRRAVALDPSFQQARLTFIHWVTGQAEYNQHELPGHGYLGSASEDIRDLLEAQGMLRAIDDQSSCTSLAEEIDALLRTARAWER